MTRHEAQKIKEESVEEDLFYLKSDYAEFEDKYDFSGVSIFSCPVETKSEIPPTSSL